MADILTPALGESVTEATVARWAKQAGETVKKDELLLELETDKVSLEVVAPEDGVLAEVRAQEGDAVTPGQVLGVVGAQGSAAAKPAAGGKGKAAAAPAASAKAAPQPAAAAAPSGELQGAKGPGADQNPAEQAPAPQAAPQAAATPQAASAPASGGGVEVTVPAMGESVTEGAVSRWIKQAGDQVKKDEVLVEIETDKVAVEVSAPADGVLAEVSVKEGDVVTPGQIIARIGGGAAQPAPAPAQSSGSAAPAAQAGSGQPAQKAAEDKPSYGGAPAAAPTPANSDERPQAPSVQRIAAENRLDLSTVQGTGKDGRLTKGDALAALEARAAAPAPAPAAPAAPRADDPREERVRMTRLRQTIARRLKEAQNSAAMLTTFNEVDMSGVMGLRTQFKDAFEKRHAVKLGFMGFFVKACIAALKDVPAVNAEIDGQDLIYKNHYDIGVAVGTEKGLVVPVVRDADQLSIAGVEKAIGDLGKKARDGQLAIADMQGGTFTISNGGVYGSLMSTPILNAPQSGILGMHKIQDRPMVVNGQVVVRPMMYLALSYDHRIVDGKEAVTFLVRVKEHIEDPQRLLLDL